MGMFEDVEEARKDAQERPLLLTAEDGTRHEVPFDHAANLAMELPGYCLRCGAYHDGVEPDACNYPCEECGTRSVYGAQELVLMGRIS